MKWIEPEYAREQVKKAGAYMVNSNVLTQEWRDSVPVFLNWRSAHAFPMQIMLDLLRKNSLRIDKKAVVVQRLKRTRSIMAKLMKEKNMSLSRMEDIGGCRAIVENVAYVNRIAESLSRSRTKNELFRTRDYINAPKESGYRGIHLIFRYKGKKTKFEKMAVELQIRSKIQHSWATALEVVGTFTKQALKASTGDAEWLNFFKYVSAEFSKHEGCPVDSRFEGIDTFKKMDESIKQLGLADRLRAFNVAANALNANNGDGSGADYYVLLLDLQERVIKRTSFVKSKQRAAMEFYDDLEKKYKDDPNKDIVLVSAGSVRDLKRAYPNYFSDTTDFEKYIGQIYEKNGMSYKDS